MDVRFDDVCVSRDLGVCEEGEGAVVVMAMAREALRVWLAVYKDARGPMARSCRREVVMLYMSRCGCEEDRTGDAEAGDYPMMQWTAAEGKMAECALQTRDTDVKTESPTVEESGDEAVSIAAGKLKLDRSWALAGVMIIPASRDKGEPKDPAESGSTHYELQVSGPI